MARIMRHKKMFHKYKNSYSLHNCKEHNEETGTLQHRHVDSTYIKGMVLEKIKKKTV